MCAVLYDAANSFIHQHFVEVSMSEEFLALPFEDVLELVSRDELNVKSEEQVCTWYRSRQRQFFLWRVFWLLESGMGYDPVPGLNKAEMSWHSARQSYDDSLSPSSCLCCQCYLALRNAW